MTNTTYLKKGKINLVDGVVITQSELLKLKNKNIKTKFITGTGALILLTPVFVNVFNNDNSETIVKNTNLSTEVEISKGNSVSESKIVSAKLLSAVHKDISYDIETVDNKLVYSVANTGIKVFTPISGEVVEKTKNKVVVENKDLNIKLELLGVNGSSVEPGDSVEEGNMIGSNISKSFEVILNLSKEDKYSDILVGYELDIDSKATKEFNYNNELIKGKSVVSSVSSEVDSILGKASEEVLESNVLKGVVLENKNQASLLNSTEVYYKSNKLPLSILEGGSAVVSDEIRNLKPIVQDELEKVGLGKFTEAFLALLQKESGGSIAATGGDVAQASQSKNGTIGGISNIRESINAGVGSFKRALEANNMFDSYETSGDVRYALQSYNFGNALGKDALKDEAIYNVSYVQEKAIEYRKEAIASGRQLYNMGAREWRGEAMYGDFTYVAKYFNIFTPENVDKKLELATKEITSQSSLHSEIVIKEAKEIAVNKEIIKEGNKEGNKEEEYYISDSVVDNKIINVMLEGESKSLNKININDLTSKNAYEILSQLKESGDYKNVRNNMLETLLTKLNNNEMNKYLIGGNYEGKVLDVLVELTDVIIGNTKPSEEEELKLKNLSGDSYSVTVDNVKYVTTTSGANQKEDSNGWSVFNWKSSALSSAKGEHLNLINNFNSDYKSVNTSLNKDIRLDGLHIVLDAGHAIKDGIYSKDTGAISVFNNGRNESEITYEWVYAFKAKLESLGCKVTVINPDGAHNYRKGDRGKYANTLDADLLFSIHFNSLNQSLRSETLVSSTNPNKSLEFANLIQNNQSKAIPTLPNGGIITNKPIGILTEYNGIAVLVEPAPISSIYGNMIAESEVVKESTLNSYVEGIQEYFGKGINKSTEDSKEAVVEDVKGATEEAESKDSVEAVEDAEAIKEDTVVQEDVSVGKEKEENEKEEIKTEEIKTDLLDEFIDFFGQ